MKHLDDEESDAESDGQQMEEEAEVLRLEEEERKKLDTSNSNSEAVDNKTTNQDKQETNNGTNKDRHQPLAEEATPTETPESQTAQQESTTRTVKK